MRLTYFEVENIKGVPRLKFQPGTITRIKGANGTGKTSVIDAVTAVFQGGSDPGWLRTGTKKGFIKFQVSDDHGNLAATITKTVSRRQDGTVKTDLEVLDPNGVAIPAPQTFINRLGESWAVDPSIILSMDTSTAAGRKEFIKRLLEILPIEFITADLIAAGVPDQAIPQRAVLSLEELTKARKYVEDMRRKIGQERDQATESEQALKKTLPADGDGTDWAAKEQHAKKAHALLVEQETKEIERERAKFEIACNEIRTKYQGERERLTGEVMGCRERADQQKKAAGVREALSRFSDLASIKAKEWLRLEGVLNQLDGLKKQKLDALPVDGLGFDGECVTVDGVPWHHVNTARRAVIAAQISSMRAGELPLLVQDDAEHLDSETRRAYEQALIEAGFQILEAVVSDGTLSVEKIR